MNSLNPKLKAACNKQTGQCTCKRGWRGNKCDIETCQFSCGKFGKCVESNKSLFRGRNAGFSSFAVRRGQTKKLSESNCGLSGKDNHVKCLIGRNEHLVAVQEKTPSWCKISKCPPELPRLCASNKCAIDCTWLGGDIEECPIMPIIESEKNKARTVWNELFESSIKPRSRRRRRRSSFQFICKCKGGYTGPSCMKPPHLDKCDTCGLNEKCDVELAECVCNSGWTKSISINGTESACTIPDLSRLGPCQWAPETWLRPDSNFLDCNLESRLRPETALSTVIMPATTKMLRLMMNPGQLIRKQDVFSMLNKAKDTVQKLYFKNLHFSNDTTLVLETPKNLKSGKAYRFF